MKEKEVIVLSYQRCLFFSLFVQLFWDFKILISLNCSDHNLAGERLCLGIQ